MKKKVLISKKKMKKILNDQFDAGFSSGREVGAHETSVGLAEKVVHPVLEASIYLIESGLSEYAGALLSALRSKSAEIAGANESCDGCDACQGEADDPMLAVIAKVFGGLDESIRKANEKALGLDEQQTDGEGAAGQV